jgi:hypothetical protein
MTGLLVSGLPRSRSQRAALLRSSPASHGGDSRGWTAQDARGTRGHGPRRARALRTAVVALEGMTAVAAYGAGAARNASRQVVMTSVGWDESCKAVFPTGALPGGGYDGSVERNPEATGVTLYWLPIGAGGRFVRRNGRIFEALASRRQHRPAQDLYHAALEVWLEGNRYTIEMGPAWNVKAADRGVVQTGPVGLRWLARSVLFRYEVRCWHNGVLPDATEAISTTLVSSLASQSRQVLDMVPQVPALTWGRDELHAGEMWNSNSLTAWLLARSGHDMTGIVPPANGRAPGWRAGEVLAARQLRGSVNHAAARTGT